MTPKLRLNEHARKPLLSCMRNSFWLGKRRTMYSTYMMLAPKTQAGSQVSTAQGHASTAYED